MVFRMTKHKHTFELDGGPCITCGKTVIEISEDIIDMNHSPVKKIKSAIERLREKGIVGKPIELDFAKARQDAIDAKNKEYREAKEQEKSRIAVIQCPSCKSTDKEHIVKSNDNGIFGPGYHSWIVEEHFVCNKCGII